MPIVLPDSPTISIDEAGIILGISRAAAYRLADRGELPTIRLGTRFRRVPTAAFLAKFGLVPAAQ